MRSTLHEAPQTSRGKVMHTLRLGLLALAALLGSGVARADEPVAPPPAQPTTPAPQVSSAPATQPTVPALQASAPAQVDTPAQAASPPSGTLPDSVRAMVGQAVVLRLKSGGEIRGQLKAVGESGFIVQKVDGTTETVPRARAKGIRLASSGSIDSEAPPSYTGTYTSSDNAASVGAEGPSQDPIVSSRTRVFGLGTSFGGGVAAASSSSGSSSTGAQPALLLPTLELSVFLPHEFSVNLIMPVLNMAVTSAVLKGTFVNMDLLLNANVGSGRSRFVGGVGLGFAFLDVRAGSATSLRIPAQIGFEVLSKKRGFGFGLLARPWVEIAEGSGGSALGGGVLGALVFTGYVTNRTGAEDP